MTRHETSATFPCWPFRWRYCSASCWPSIAGRWDDLAYLVSFSGLYSGLFLSVNRNQPALVLMFTTTSALFHAVEYLAIVSWAVRSRHGRQNGEATLFRRLLPQWALALAVFASVIGAGNWLMRHHLLEIWLLLNVMIAFLHYTYDGMIWKSRRRRAGTSGGVSSGHV